MLVNHPRAVAINGEIQKKVTEFEHILITMQMNKYLNFFLFQTFMGMAYNDAKSFECDQHIVTIDGKDIDRHRIKTGNKFVTPILPITRKILERNNYKMEISSNQKYNQFLKDIGLVLSSSFLLTTMSARHTFACTVALGRIYLKRCC